MDIQVLGCSGGIGSGLRTTCLRVGDDVLIDAGTGIADLGLASMAHIRHIFLTHSHLDHIAGIPLLVDSVFEQLKNHPLTVYGQAETIKAFQEHIFNWVIWPDFTMLPNEEEPVIQFKVMAPGETVHAGDRDLEMIAVNHAVPGVAYRVEGEGKSLMFSGDTTTNDEMWESMNAKSVDALIVECAFPDSELELSKKAFHYCPTLLAEDLRKLKIRPPVYISHLKPGAEEQIVSEVQSQCPDFKITRLFDGDLIAL